MPHPLMGFTALSDEFGQHVESVLAIFSQHCSILDVINPHLDHHQ